MGTLPLRFDEMIPTVLAQAEQHPSAAIAKWRQLVDLLAQRRDEEGSAAVAEALAWLRERRSAVPETVRVAVARSLAGRRIAPAALLFFAEDKPSVAAPLIGGAMVGAEDWLRLLSGLGPTSRALLRHRRDLPHEVTQALASFGASDFALSGTVTEVAPTATHNLHLPETPAEADEAGETQIRELVARIENFRRKREAAAKPPAVLTELGPAEEFQWESGADGTILWIEGAPRGPLIGQSIASIAERGQFGVDGQAAGAFE